MELSKFKTVEQLAAAMKTMLVGDGARVYNNADITISNDTWTDLTFNTERWDINDYHSTSSNTDRLTIPFAGKYLVIGNIKFTANATGVRYVAIYDGTNYLAMDRNTSSSGSQDEVMHISTIYDFDASDYVTLRVYQNSTADLDIISTGNYSPEFMIYRLS